MSNFLAFIDAGISAPGPDSVEDGRDLAKECIKTLEELENQEQFPPRLLILLTSPSFLEADKAQQLITGVHGEFKKRFKNDIPLIGSSVAAVFYKNKIHAEGALLICLASRIIEAEVAVVTNVSQKIEDAPASIVKALHINSQTAQQTSLLPHSLLLTFLPGSGSSDIEARQLTEKLHNNLWDAVNHQIRIVGGVSSANDPARSKPGLQFANQVVYKDAVVAALISSGVPLGENLTNGVDWHEEEVLKVQEVSTSGRYIKKLEGNALNEWLDDKKKFVLFKQGARSSDRVMAFSDNRSNPRKIQALREVKKGDYLSPGELTPKVMYKNARKAIERSKESMRIKNPIGCFSMKCTSHYREKEFLDLKIEDGIARLSDEMLEGRPYVGGFFDGEIGMDKTGRSVYGNWGVATIVFGDEMSDSTLMQRGYASMNAHSAALSSTFDLEEALSKSVDLVCDIGFPGAMISFLLPGHHRTYIIAQKAKGPRFSRIKDITQRDLDGPDILARIARENIDEPHFIRDSRKETGCDPEAVEKSGIISQCIIRLKDPKNNTLATLQVDLGDSRYKPDLYPKEKEMLDSIGAFIAANLSRIFIWNENEIAHKLDKALVLSLSADNILQTFVEQATRAFGLRMGHIRLIDQDQTDLVIRAGVGQYYEAAKELRLQIGRDDESPTIVAFNDKEAKPNIINYALENDWHNKLCQRYKDLPQMSAALAQVGSYANIPFKNSEQTIGTINLISTEKWFFRGYHQNAFDSLAQQVVFLVEHLTSKQNETLLRAASLNLSLIPDFHNTTDVLANATEKFCDVLGAEHAALYLWDKDSSLYILRSAYKWASGKDWVGVAFYGKEEGWIGNLAANANGPLPIADLYSEYDKLSYGKYAKRYAKEIFGQDLSETFTVEALALPLIVMGEHLGVLTLYRKVAKPGKKQPTGFTTTEPNLLQHLADPFAGLVKIVRDHQNTMWDNLEKQQRADIYDLLPPQEARNFEARTCKQLLKSLSAKQVVFYSMDEFAKANWVTGYKDDLNKPIRTPRPTLDQKKYVEEAAQSEKTRCELIIDDGDKAYKGTVKGAQIPLVASNLLVGVLDISWDIDKSQKPPLTGERGKNHLSSIGKMIGSAYYRHDLIVMNKKKGLALYGLTKGISLSHQLSNQIRTIKNWSEELKDPEKLPQINFAARKINEAADLIDKLFKKKVEFFTEVSEGKEILLDVQKSLEKVLKTHFHREHFERIIDFSHPLNITGVPDIVEEIFKMLIENSAKEMKLHARPSVLTIQGKRVETKDGEQSAVVIITDTGGGMSEEIKALLPALYSETLPFNKAEDRFMFGIYYSISLLHLMGGELRFDDNPAGGTVAIVTLPYTEMEKTQ